MLVARIYMRVSTDEQDLQRQEGLIENAKAKGFYIAGVYKEKISGNTEWTDRPEFFRLVNDLQPGEIVIAESMDRLTRLEPNKALELLNAIQSKGAKIQVPEVFDFDAITQFFPGNSSDTFSPSFLMSDIFNAMQNMLFKIAISIARDDYTKRRERQKQGIEIAKTKGKYKGRPANNDLHNAIIEQRKKGVTIEKTAKILNTSTSTVIRAWSKYKKLKNNKN